MIDDLATWQSTYAALPQVADPTWAPAFADWVSARVTGKAVLTGITCAVPAGVFNFNKTTFSAALVSLVPTVDPVTGITGFATAWETAIQASLVLGVLPGDSLGAPTPATLWSIVTTALIDVASIVVGKAVIMTLSAEVPTADPATSKFPEKFRNAFLSLTGTVSGTNSVPPPAGPNPLVAAAVAFQ